MYKLIISQTFVSNTKLRGFCWTEIKLWIRVKGIFHVTLVVDVIDCIKFDMKALPLLMLLTVFWKYNRILIAASHFQVSSY